MATYKSISKSFTWGSGFTGGDSFAKIASQTASSDSVVNFTSGIDSTYNVYLFQCINVHPSAGSKLTMQFTSDGTNFNRPLKACQGNDSNTEAASASNNDEAESESQYNGTNYQSIVYADTLETNNESCCNANIWLWGPSDTTFTKHFWASGIGKDDAPGAARSYTAGVIVETSAITGVSFKMSSGNIDSGTFTMYGLVK